VILLEARDRLGGRAWTGTFAGTSHQIEIGGAWVAPELQPYVASNMDRYGLPFKQDITPATLASLVGGRRIDGVIPVPVEELADFERAIVHIARAAERIDPTRSLDVQVGLEDLDVSWDAFLEPLGLPSATRDYLNAWVAMFGGCRTSDWAALHILQWTALMGNSPYQLATSLDHKIGGGTRTLLDAIASDHPFDVRLESPVLRVRQDDSEVTVETAAGTTVAARAAVIATPANVWKDIQFSPCLNAGKRASADQRVGGYAVKSWALVADAPDSILGVANPEQGGGIVWLVADRETDDGWLVVGFSVDPDGYDALDRAQVERAMQAHMPGCRLLACDSHDWIADQYAKGTWASWPPGMITGQLSDMRASEGRLVFATSDIASFFAGWLEGALESGAAAAEKVAAILAEDPVPATN
jgi:monoamine oxidase